MQWKLRVMALFALGFLGLGVTACGSASNSSSSASSQTLVVDHSYPINLSQDVDPAKGGNDSDFGAYFRAVYDTLLTYQGSNTSKLIPLVAQSYTANSDATEFTFQLRHDVKFSDGTPLTAEDVVFSLQRLINLQSNASWLLGSATGGGAGVTSVTAPNKYTVIVSSSEPSPQMPAILASPVLGIVNSKLLRAHGGTDASDAATADTAQQYLLTHSVGSGPYVMDSISVNQVVLTKNPKYWGPDRPHFAKVIFRNVTSATELLDAARDSNEINLGIPANQISSLKGNSKVHVSTSVGTLLTYAYCNANPKVSSVCANKDFEQAVRYAIDYSGLVALNGSGAEQAAGLVPPQFLGALAQGDAVKRDLSHAKSLLQQSGLTNPTVELDYETGTTAGGVAADLSAEYAAKIQSSLAQIGVTVKLNGLPEALYIPAYRGGTAQMNIATWAPDYSDPQDYLAFMPGALVGLRVGWPTGSDPSIEALATQAASAVKAPERQNLYQKLQNEMNQQSPIFPLTMNSEVMVSSSNLTNVDFNAVWTLDFAAIGSK